jgi:hypothetical protein
MLNSAAAAEITGEKSDFAAVRGQNEASKPLILAAL